VTSEAERVLTLEAEGSSMADQTKMARYRDYRRGT
jgi:hypothetical protein